ncbi:uncharacterized protein LOC126320402 isoform X2 [Schistocerca gregaria]|uniref:uncharacterized protein LOC126320402 isoform X2 n=1 Tax=Schistocerca gregaria TaxID=7010 RepID=UPI00211EF6AA|nr:uncharacterized protein LOC126320402 isoform X2 [Schistocerca gregaria]
MSDRKICTYEVTPLDTLNGVALKFGMETSELLRLNGISKYHHINVGQILHVYEKPNQADFFDHSNQTEHTSTESDSRENTDLSYSDSVHISSDSPSLQISTNNRSSFSGQNGNEFLHYVMRRLYAERDLNIFKQSSFGSYAKELFSSTSSKESLNNNSVLMINDGCANLGRLLCSNGSNQKKAEYIQKRLIPGRLCLLPNSIKFEPCLYNCFDLSLLDSAVFQIEYSDIVDIQILDSITRMVSILNTDDDSSNLCNQKEASESFDPENQISNEISLPLDSLKENMKGNLYKNNSNIGYECLIQKLRDRSLEVLRLVASGILSCTGGQKQEQVTNVFHFLVSRHTGDTFLDIYRQFCQLRQSSKPPISVQLSYLSESPSDEDALFTPTLNWSSAILTTEELKLLARALPPRFRLSNWKLLYSSRIHGISIHTLYNRTRDQGPSYLLIEDECRFQFGAYLSDSWAIRDHYYEKM